MDGRIVEPDDRVHEAVARLRQLYVDGRAVESVMVCPDCEIALLSGVSIAWRGGIWTP